MLTLGLGHAEEGPDTHGDQDGAEEEVGAVAEVGDHVRGRPGDDEGSKPGVGGRKGHAEHADVEREDLRRVGPSDTLPVSEWLVCDEDHLN